MDPQTQLVLSIIVGYAMQWGKSLKRLPDPVVYAGAGVLGIGILFLSAKDPLAAGWRPFIWNSILSLFTVCGVARISSDTKAAPKSNSL